MGISLLEGDGRDKKKYKILKSLETPGSIRVLEN